MSIPRLFQAILGGSKGTISRFAVEGMNCGSCVQRIEKALAGLPGVASVKANLPTARVTIEHDPAKITAQALADKITAAGYAATKLQP